MTILTCFCGIPGGPGRHGLCFGLHPFSGTINHCFVGHCERIVPSISHSFEFYMQHQYPCQLNLTWKQLVHQLLLSVERVGLSAVGAKRLVVGPNLAIRAIAAIPAVIGVMSESLGDRSFVYDSVDPADPFQVPPVTIQARPKFAPLQIPSRSQAPRISAQFQVSALVQPVERSLDSQGAFSGQISKTCWYS